MGAKIYVGGLPYAATEKQLHSIFAAHGSVAKARIITDKFVGQSGGFGFVEMSSEAEAEAAIQALNESGLGDGRAIKEVEEMSVSEENKETQQQPEEQSGTGWQERVKRTVGIDRQSKVPMEVLMRPEVRPDIIALGVAHGMAGQKYIEHLIVNAVNKDDGLVTKGKQYIKRAKGNIRRAIALAQEDGATPFQDDLDKPISSRHR